MWDSYYCYLESLIFLYIRFRVYGTFQKGAHGFVLHCHSWDFRLFSDTMYLGLNQSISTGNLIFIRLIPQVLFKLTFHHFHLPSLWRPISLFLQLPDTLHPTADRGCRNQESSSRKSDQSCWLDLLRSYGKNVCLLQSQVLTSFTQVRPMPSNLITGTRSNHKKKKTKTTNELHTLIHMQAPQWENFKVSKEWSSPSCPKP